MVAWEILRRREERIRQRNIHRIYLTRPNLNPSLRVGTPWQHMHARGNDRVFIMTMGIDVTTFEYILDQGFAETWDSTPIPCNDISLLIECTSSYRPPFLRRCWRSWPCSPLSCINNARAMLMLGHPHRAQSLVTFPLGPASRHFKSRGL